MTETKIQVVLIIMLVVAFGLFVVVVETEKKLIESYDETIEEYMMCIKYDIDCDCSDIILSEYGEEVE